jgi:hypothetical protein
MGEAMSPRAEPPTNADPSPSQDIAEILRTLLRVVLGLCGGLRVFFLSLESAQNALVPLVAFVASAVAVGWGVLSRHPAVRIVACAVEAPALET